MPKQIPAFLSGRELRDIFLKVGYAVFAERGDAWFLHKPGSNPLIIRDQPRYDWKAIHHLRVAAELSREAFEELID